MNMVVEQHCKDTKCHLIIHFKMINLLLCEFHLKKNTWRPTSVQSWDLVVSCMYMHTHRDFFATHSRKTLQEAPGRNTPHINSSGPASNTTPHFPVVKLSFSSFVHVLYPQEVWLFCVSSFIFSPPAVAFLYYWTFPAELSQDDYTTPHHISAFHPAAPSKAPCSSSHTDPNNRTEPSPLA